MVDIKLSSDNVKYWNSFRRILESLLATPGHTRRRIAEAVGASEQAVGAWARGASKPSADNLLRLSDYWGIALDKLMGRVAPGTEALQEATMRARPILEALERLIPETGSAEPAVSGERHADAEKAAAKKKRSKSTKRKTTKGKKKG